MLIVGINGSPKKEGNTKYLINTVLEEAKSQGVETMVLEVGELLNSVKTHFVLFAAILAPVYVIKARSWKRLMKSSKKLTQ